MSVGLGCLPILMMYHLVGGAWGYSIRRLLESGTRTVLLLAVLLLLITAWHLIGNLSHRDAPGDE